MTRTRLAIASLAALAGTTHAADISVPGDFFTVTAAVANASAGDTINIGAGFYPENIVVNKNLTIRGAGVGVTIMEGQGLDSVFEVASGADVTFESMTIQGGEGGDRGGAINALTAGAVLIVRDCSLENNSAIQYGGAIYINAGNLTVEDSTISDNSVGESGGGVYLNNSSATYTDVLFSTNHADVNGGAIDHFGGSSTYTDCTFIGNTADANGGAFMFGSGGGHTVNTSWFEMNGATRGGSIRTAVPLDISNSVFLDSNASAFGGGIYTTSDVDVVNSTFSGHTSGGSGGTFEVPSGGNLDLLNSIVVNAAAASKGGAGVFNARNSIIPEAPAGTPDANGNTSDDPMFVDAPNKDFRLLAASPAIDSGDSLGSAGSLDVTDYTTDFDNNDRNLDDPATPNTGVPAWALNIDKGAYEFQPAGSPGGCLADTTTTGAGAGEPGFGEPDGSVTTADLQFFVNAWVTGCP